MSVILQKYLVDVRNFVFDFSLMEELAGGDTIASIVGVSATPSGLTLGTTAIVGRTVTTVISGGTANTEYTIICTITTASGATIEAVGLLNTLT